MLDLSLVSLSIPRKAIREQAVIKQTLHHWKRREELFYYQFFDLFVFQETGVDTQLSTPIVSMATPTLMYHPNQPAAYAGKTLTAILFRQKTQIETDRYIGLPICEILNIGRYTNLYRYFGVLVYSTVCTKFNLIKEKPPNLLKFVQQNFSYLVNIFCQ